MFDSMHKHGFTERDTPDSERQWYPDTQGPKGEKGDKGDAATIAVIATNTVGPDRPARVVNEGTDTDARLAFDIPRGQQGLQGDEGVPGPEGPAGLGLYFKGDVDTVDQLPKDGNKQGDWYLVGDNADMWVFNGDKWVDAHALRGPAGPQGKAGGKGDKGDAATVTADGATSIPYGEQPSVVNDGTTSDAKLHFNIPAGKPGETGKQGPMGPQGPDGEMGPQGVPGVQGPQGIPGLGLVYRGTVDDVKKLPAKGQQGDWWMVNDHMYVWDGGAWSDAGNLQGPTGPTGQTGAQGPRGDKGDAATIDVDTSQTQTLDPDEDAVVVNVGSKNAAVLAFALPRGKDGAQGGRGPQGIQGIPGPKGDKGDKGDLGPQGNVGPAGPKGDDGPAGPKGDTGATGPAGAKGDTGATGPAGPAGPKGDTGAVGPAGPKGDKGDKGDTGATTAIKIDASQTKTLEPDQDAIVVNVGTEDNPVLAFGLPRGKDGTAGAKGDKGDKGDTGPAGPKGDKGDTGDPGKTGPAGPTGPTGAAGPKGDPGPTGPAGAKGDTGATGPAGKDYTPFTASAAYDQAASSGINVKADLYVGYTNTVCRIGVIANTGTVKAKWSLVAKGITGVFDQLATNITAGTIGAPELANGEPYVTIAFFGDTGYIAMGHMSKTGALTFVNQPADDTEVGEVSGNLMYIFADPMPSKEA